MAVPETAVDRDISYRADIDGLRAVAVLAVIGFHAGFKSLSGGYVGVDIFFVISGFLISSLILGKLKSATFSFVDFYARRARRLFPALLTVLLVVWAIGWFAMWPNEFAALGRHMAAAAAFAANLLLYSEVGYFDVPAATKPLLHLWSLGVEEQFYIVFPALLLLIWRLGAARWILIVLGAASFALNVAIVHKDQSFAFYLPFTRFWEFVGGALMAHAAIIGPSLRGASLLSRKPDVAAVTGLLLVAASISLIPSDVEFPGWWALPPTCGALLIIGAGPDAWFNRKVLANPKVVYIGLISYPLYLWHWPLIVIGRATAQYYSPANPYTRTTALAAVVLALILSWLTYEFIERPIRARKPVIALRPAALVSATGLAGAAALGLATVQGAGLPERYPAAVQTLLRPIAPGADYPPPDETKNVGGPLVVIIGDSHSNHLRPGLQALQNERTFRLKPMGWNDCAPIGTVRRVDPDICAKVTAANKEEFERLKPDIVVISAFWWQYPHIEKIADYVSFLKSVGVKRIVLMGSVPYWPQLPQILLYKAYRADPMHRVPTRLGGFNPETREVDKRLQEIAARFGVTFISLYDALCDEKGCLVRLGDSEKDIIQPDLTHFSAEGSAYVISHVTDQIFK